jgi:catalase-peroxidase
MTGKGRYTITSGLEGAWTANPTKWDSGYFDVLFGYEWKLTKSPAGAFQWTPVDKSASDKVPDAHDPQKRHPPMMLTSDLALIKDPIYRKISERFHKNPTQLKEAFAKAWYKLTHRDMGPYARCLGPEVPPPQKWQDPLPTLQGAPLTAADQSQLKDNILKSGLSPSRLVATAWASASTFRQTDKRGGANGARIRLDPQKTWLVNERNELDEALIVFEDIQSKFNATGKKVSIADLIVLGGCAGVEAAAKAAGHDVTVPFTPGRTDATQETTDAESFAVLEPLVDGFRNFIHPKLGEVKAEELLVEKAHLLSLTVPEMTVLVGGLRVLGIGTSGSSAFTDRVGVLTSDFFVNLLDMRTVWSPAGKNFFEGRDRTSGEATMTATGVDLIFGSHSVLRAVAEVYACQDSEQDFVHAFCLAFAKVMDLDRFDVLSTRVPLSRL